MNKCLKCNIKVADDAIMCPLCHAVLEPDMPGEQTGNAYPNEVKRTRRVSRFLRWIMGFSILVEAILVFINYMTYRQSLWSLVCGLGFIYAYVSIRMILSGNSGHVMKLWLQSIGIGVGTVLLDHILGYSGWSVNYAIPVAILSVQVIVVILMFANWGQWTNYLLLQLFLLIISGGMIALEAVGVVTRPILSHVALLVSVGVFVCTLSLGGKKAKTEMKRKFHM